MDAQLTRAIRLAEEASAAEKEGNLNRAEVLYVESRELFLLVGDRHWIDAAQMMNLLAEMKEKYGDYEGARNAATKSLQILDDHISPALSQSADNIRLQSWAIITRARYAVAR